MEIFRNVIPRYTAALRLHHDYHFVTRLEFIPYSDQPAMEGADGSGVQENERLMGNGTTAAEPVTLLAVERSSGLEAGEAKENRTGPSMKNGLPEPIGSKHVDSPNVPQSVVSPRTISHPQLGIIPSASEVRRILGPLIAHNSLARNGALEKEKPSAEPHGDIQNLLTDEICNKFVGQMRVVEKQRGTLPLNGTSNMDNNQVPKAPRAMLISEKDLNVNNPNPDMRIPIPSSAIDTALPIVREAAPSNSSSTSDEGIAIPLDTKFFTHVKSLEREEGEITSSRPPTVASDIARKASPVKTYPLDGGRFPRRSASPETALHRLASRTYRNRSPERLVRPSSRHSHSPSHPRRPISPEDRTSRRSRSPEGPRRRRSSPSPRIPHAFDRPPLISPLSATHTRRGSYDDTRRGKYTNSEPYPSTDRDNYHSVSPTSRYPERQKDAFSARDGMTPSDHSASNHDWQRGSTQERGSDAESSRPQAEPSMSTNNIHHNADDQRHSPSGGPSPSSTVGTLPDTTKGDFGPPPQVVKACHNVPGLWMVKSGQSSIEIVSCEFEIDTVTAEKWNIRGPSRNGKEKAHDTLSLSLACVPLSEIVAVRGKLDLASATPQEIAHEMAQIETIWPPGGQLVIQVNPDQEWGRSWLPRHLGEGHSSINIINHVHEGTNVIRFIQLANLADRMFLVLAKEKPPDLDTIDLEPELDVAGAGALEEGPETTEQLLKSFIATTRIIYS